MVGPIEGRDLNFPPESCQAVGHGNTDYQVVVLATEGLVRFHMNKYVKVTCGPPGISLFTLSVEPESRPGVNARGNPQSKFLLYEHPPNSMALQAWVLDHGSAALAGWTSGADRKETLRSRDLPTAATSVADRGLSPALGPGPAAFVTRFMPRNFDLCFLPEGRVHEIDSHVNPEVRASPYTAPASPFSAEAEELLEDVSKR